MLKILAYIKGFVRVSVTGRFVERFLNICMNRKIHIWDIKSRGTELLHVSMSVNGFRQMPSAAFKTKTRVKIISRHGVPFLLARHKKRKMFLTAGIVMLIIFVCITSFIWDIDIEGNEKVSDEIILKALKSNGLDIGNLRYGNDVTALQNKMLLDIKELSWLWVDIRGTRAVVQVKEKTPIPTIVDRKIPCNIIAEADGVITDMEATYGEKIVSVGDVVKKGDLLIGGISNTKYGGIHYLHSSGTVKARTWHSKTGEFSLKKVDFSKTGKKISKNTMNFFGFRVKLYLKNNLPFKYSEENVSTHHMSIGENIVLPIYVERHIYDELLRHEQLLSADDALKLASAELSAQLESELSDDTIIVNKAAEIISTSENAISVRVSYECIENIGVEVPIVIQ